LKRIFITDLEGPISKNDNAFEITTTFVPNGDKFFAMVSKYDDILADVFKKPGYKAGDTLKLILPFLKAYRVTNKKIKEYSAKSILLLPTAEKTLQCINKIMPSYIVSTSYEQYICALCEQIKFPKKNAYCTKLNLDKYKIEKSEIQRLKELAEEISRMPMMEIPKNAKSIRGFSLRDQKTIKRLDKIFWEEIPKIKIGKILKEVNPVGGTEKANAIQEIVKKTGAKLSDIVYVGDSITDVPALQKVRRGGGLTVSFNGNSYAIREAEIAVMSERTLPTSILAHAFNRLGKKGVLKLVKEWSHNALQKYKVDKTLQKRAKELYPTKLPRVEIITNKNREKLMRESSAYRKTVRGIKIGALG